MLKSNLTAAASAAEKSAMNHPRHHRRQLFRLLSELCRAIRLLACWLVLGILAGGVAFAESAVEWNDQGLKHYAAREFPAAVAAFRKAHYLSPENATLQHNLIEGLNGWAVSLGKTGDYASALARLEEAQRLDTRQPDVRSNLAVLRVNYATSEMEQGHYDTAENLLAKAYETADTSTTAQIDDRRATLFTLKARGLRSDGHDEAALAALKRALQVNPKFVPALLTTADILYRQGNNLDALDYYVDALEQDPHIEGLNALVEKILREEKIEGGFEKLSSDFFNVSYQGAVNPAAAREVLGILRSAYREIGRELECFPSEKLPVVLYLRAQYNDATVAPEWSGALYDGKIRVPLPTGELSSSEVEKLRKTLDHEYTHALVNEIVPHASTPTWLNEGLAQYFEVDRDVRRERDAQDRRELAPLARQGRLKGVSGLPDVFTAIKDPKDAERAYQISRSFVNWLAARYRTAWLRRLLDALNTGEPVDKAVEAVYRKSLGELEKDWLDDLKG